MLSDQPAIMTAGWSAFSGAWVQPHPLPCPPGTHWQNVASGFRVHAAVGLLVKMRDIFCRRLGGIEKEGMGK
ncbi:hypothetical protein D7X33_19870 [Butyricicoccus sp. 1XD8-22]|nr:hypothetical protein D7X33_19870 [Butyricicoccus sp. 1XD8-22]